QGPIQRNYPHSLPCTSSLLLSSSVRPVSISRYPPREYHPTRRTLILHNLTLLYSFSPLPPFLLPATCSPPHPPPTL
ncbi:hypothetical protein CORC01_11664, partial [Colletotrichum orchidophilum]